MVGIVNMVGRSCLWRCSRTGNRSIRAIYFARSPLHPAPIGQQGTAAHPAKPVVLGILLTAASALLRLPGDDAALRRPAFLLQRLATAATKLVIKGIRVATRTALHGDRLQRAHSRHPLIRTCLLRRTQSCCGMPVTRGARDISGALCPSRYRFGAFSFVLSQTPVVG